MGDIIILLLVFLVVGRLLRGRVRRIQQKAVFGMTNNSGLL